MIKNLIFDIGNVLVDYNWRGFLKAQGFEPEMVERIGKAAPLSKEWNEYDRGVWTDEEILDSFVKNDPEIEPELRKAYAKLPGHGKDERLYNSLVKGIKGQRLQTLLLVQFFWKSKKRLLRKLAISAPDGRRHPFL